jgi:GTPase SAR1 family protein
MIENNFRKWLNEAVEKNKNFYVLVGPPAAGKSSWIRDFIETSNQTYMVISRDQIIEDQIFPNYKLSNNELYTINPPKDAELGKNIEGMEKYGKVVIDKKGRRAFENILKANAEVEAVIKKEIKAALTNEPDNIVIDAINGTDRERSIALGVVKDKPNYKKIAVYFEFEPYKEKIMARAQDRADKMKKDFGYSFAREIPEKAYDAIFARITKPHISEGFDEISSYDSFKGVKTATMQPTAESLTRAFREFLNQEDQLPNDNATGHEGPLEEARLSKVWKKRAKARAKRQERDYTKQDLKWAHKRQTEMHKKHPELEEEYLKEIAAAQELAKSTKEYLNRLKQLRKKKMEEKQQELVAPTPKNLKNRPKPAKNPYTDPEYRKTKFKSRAKWLEKHKIPSAAGSFGGIAEEEEIKKEE